MGGAMDYCMCLVQKEEEPSSSRTYRFLGGVLDSMDHAIAAGHSLTTETETFELAVRVAALRIVFSETGALLAAPAPPNALREPTRQVLLRDGPGAFLNCMIIWDGDNPNPRMT